MAQPRAARALANAACRNKGGRDIKEICAKSTKYVVAVRPVHSRRRSAGADVSYRSYVNVSSPTLSRLHPRLREAIDVDLDFILPTSTPGSHCSHSHPHPHPQPYAHSRSFSDHTSFLSPYPIGANGHSIKKAVSANDLYTHAETSRETSPILSPSFPKQSWHTRYGQEPRSSHYKHSHPPNGHARSYSAFVFPMKSGRARGESDLGRPANPQSAVYRPALEGVDSDLLPGLARWIPVLEALTGWLIPLPYMRCRSEDWGRAWSCWQRPAPV